MRDYAKLSSTFWTGETGKMLRGNATAQVVALYLVSCSHANMIGLYHCPITYISHDTGHPLEGASEALRSLQEAHFCTFDAARDLVWVHEMARFQIGDDLKPKDNRISNVAKQLAGLPKCPITFAFFHRYADAFLLESRPELEGLRRAMEGASKGVGKPLRSQEQEQEQENLLSQHANLSRYSSTSDARLKFANGFAAARDGEGSQ